MESKKEIYFHVGTGKTGTTYLQMKVFPFVKGIHYIPTNRYRRIFDILKDSKEPRILVSREFDRQMEREVKKFAEHYSDNVQPIVVFRRQDSYIASQYRRFVKNGYQGDLKSFLDHTLTMNRSPNWIASCVFAACHSFGARFHLACTFLSAR